MARSPDSSNLISFRLHPDASAGTIGFVFRLPHTQVPAPALLAGISE
jgi:hypothetical protein